MAIEPVKRVTIIAPRQGADRLLETLYEVGSFHVADTSAFLPQDAELNNVPASTEDADRHIQSLTLIESVLDLFDKPKQSIVEGFATIPIAASPQEMEQALKADDTPELHSKCQCIFSRHHQITETIKQIEQEIAGLEPWVGINIDASGAHKLKRTQVALGQMAPEKWDALCADARTTELLATQPVSSKAKTVYILAAWLNKDRDAALDLLQKSGWRQLPVPDVKGTVSEHLAELQSDLASRNSDLEDLKAQVAELSQHRRTAAIQRAYWESQRAMQVAKTRMKAGKRVCVATGYVREREMDKTIRAINERLPDASLLAEDPKPGESVPVSIKLHPAIKPAQLLISMFGLPDYFTFDPTPYLIGTFILFFGICLGDAVYGVLMALASWHMMRKYRHAEAIHGFFFLFMYCGICAAIMGVLTGSWAGDLYLYLGEGNALQRIRNQFLVLDTLQKPIIGLLVAVALGILNQFYGIGLKIYRDLRMGHIGDAVFDAGLWLVMLPGFLIILAPLFMPLPALLVSVGKWLFIGGAAGVVLTGGRKEEGFFGKAITGLVSVYGILGSYGCASFIGDILSYARLLALSLTTSIIGSAVNMFATMLPGILAGFAGLVFGQAAAGIFEKAPAVALVISVIVILFGHVTNLLLGILGAFVHSVRLQFLEFFNRFYEGGAPRFSPLGFSSPSVVLTKSRE
ncbi:MAG TPA: V-type ATP synthase subunit I [Candidatus Brocadiia bacterium]|nr:V-type ATP synthase subunit I [Candidatus Brocadiia bacterium]